MKRVRRTSRCPVCGFGSWCMVGETAVLCMRVPSPKPARQGGWLHPIPPSVADKEAQLLDEVDHMARHLHPGAADTRADARRCWEDLARWLAVKHPLASLRHLAPAHVSAYLRAREKRGDSPDMIRERLGQIASLHARWPGRAFRGDMAKAVLGDAEPGPAKPLLDQVAARQRLMRRLAPSTRQAYAVVWRRFASFAGVTFRLQALRNAARKHIDAYLEQRGREGLGDAALAWERHALMALVREVEDSRREPRP